VVGATVATHPIDVVKVRLQLADGGGAGAGGGARADAFSVSRFLRLFPELCRREGVNVLFSGLTAAAWRAATYGTVRIGFCEPLERATGSRLGGALLAGVAATVLGNPLEVLKVRLQARTAGSSAGMACELRTMVRDEGWRVLGRGFQWSAARTALLTASQVVPYSEAKRALLKHGGLSDGPGCHLLASVAAGLVTSTVTAPVDVLKTRVMNASKVTAASSVTATSPLAMLAEEGPFVFFRGWVANYMRIGPQTLLIFVLYEQSQALVRQFAP